MVEWIVPVSDKKGEYVLKLPRSPKPEVKEAILAELAAVGSSNTAVDFSQVPDHQARGWLDSLLTYKRKIVLTGLSEKAMDTLHGSHVADLFEIDHLSSPGLQR